MKRGRKIYYPSFNTKAVQLNNKRDYISELARELGIKVSLLYKWRKEYEEFGEGSFLRKKVILN
jgi:transposase